MHASSDQRGEMIVFELTLARFFVDRPMHWPLDALASRRIFFLFTLDSIALSSFHFDMWIEWVHGTRPTKKQLAQPLKSINSLLRLPKATNFYLVFGPFANVFCTFVRRMQTKRWLCNHWNYWCWMNTILLLPFRKWYTNAGSCDAISSLCSRW